MTDSEQVDYLRCFNIKQEEFEKVFKDNEFVVDLAQWRVTDPTRYKYLSLESDHHGSCFVKVSECVVVADFKYKFRFHEVYKNSNSALYIGKSGGEINIASAQQSQLSEWLTLISRGQPNALFPGCDIDSAVSQLASFYSVDKSQVDIAIRSKPIAFAGILQSEKSHQDAEATKE